MREESSWPGFTFSLLTFIRIPIDNFDDGLILGVYICEVGNMEEIQLSDEHTEYGWFSGKEVSELLKVKYPKEFTDKLLELK